MVCVGFMSELRSYKREYNLQNQELERQHDYTNMYLLKTMSWADMQKSKRPRENKSEKWKWSCSVLRLFVTPWNVAYQAPLSMGFSRQEYWSGLPFPSSGDLPNPGIELWYPALQADALPSEPPGKMGRYESGASSKGSAQVRVCMQPCAPSLIHQYWLNSLLCAGHRTRLWNTEHHGDKTRVLALLVFVHKWERWTLIKWLHKLW